MFGVRASVVHTCLTARTLGVTGASYQSLMVGWPTKRVLPSRSAMRCALLLTHRGSAENRGGGGVGLSIKESCGSFKRSGRDLRVTIGPALQGARQGDQPFQYLSGSALTPPDNPLTAHHQQLADEGCFQALNP
jgi:hypothetical protein